MDKQQKFKNITTEMSELYSAKNHDYGDAFGQTFAELGIISAITRISDKTNRLKSLATKDQLVDDERIEDTLMDLANYAVMTLVELKGTTGWEAFSETVESAAQKFDEAHSIEQPMETVIAYSDGEPVFKTEQPMKLIAGQYLDEVYFHHDDLLKRLQNVHYEWLARDQDGGLWASRVKPKKYDNVWDDVNDDHSTIIENDNLPEVKWTDDEPTKISDLLAIYKNGGENGK